ncbi:MAG: undecaprenyldiphospho-muramoylpentapeptide beta-N-acetylglucosaminyltransferase [Candidatus Aminicenantes bacterium RBG_13_62_12]|nr:MAG: undecaprenyldiphospho-muramoylpentapeptide beta-N-acetylglucosaminyltransferase [Candidatus Aminicenantes bacterium RBG_13_62_12]
MRPRRVAICGGGTGGHILPALAVGRKLREALPGVRLAFIGTRRKVEMEIMARSGEEFHPLQIAGLRGRGWRVLPSLLRIPAALVQSLLLIKKIRPDLVIGAGGYSSGPFVLLASLLGKPTIILEQNVKPGLTNRWLLPFVRRAVASFERTLPDLRGKGVFLGNPVREEFAALEPRTPDGKLNLLVFGGSQGSRFLNDLMTAALPQLAPGKNNLRIRHQTGAADEKQVREAYVRAGFQDAEVTAFIVDMASAFSRADLIICRAGATTVAELIAGRKAALLIPFGRAAGGHQMENAKELERAGGAEVWSEDRITPEKLAERILFYAGHPGRMQDLAGNLKALGTDNAAGQIVELCLKIMRVHAEEE